LKIVKNPHVENDEVKFLNVTCRVVIFASASFLVVIAHNFLGPVILAYMSSVLESEFCGLPRPGFRGPPNSEGCAVTSLNAFDPENPYGLTHLERQVVDLLMSGQTTEQVSETLFLDHRDVALRRASAMRKFGARNGLHLAHLIATIQPQHYEPDCIVLEDVPSAFAF